MEIINRHLKKIENYNKLIPQLLHAGKKPYPVYKYNFKSEKYNYVYNESLNEYTYWHGRLCDIIFYTTQYGNSGVTSWDFYSDSEEKCAKEVYKTIKKYLSRITRQNKLQCSGHYKRHIKWQEWITNYESTLLNNS